MSRTDGKGRRQEWDDEEDVKYLRKPQRSHSVSPELRTRIKSGATITKDAGAVDEEQFRLGFEDVKQVSFASGYELEKGLMSIHAILSNTNEDWEKRVDQLKRFRGFIVAGAAEYKEFQVAMRYMDLALQTSVKDLRSQVVREACISIAFLAATLGLKCERTAEMLLPTLILLIPNSARVMASSGLVAIRLLLTYVHSHKLIPIITQECLASKSKETRRACCEFVKIALSSFPKAVLERHVAGLRETLKKSMSDADSETRALARQAYAAFAVIFPVQARDLYKELDLPKQRLLNEAGFGPTYNHSSVVPTTPAATTSNFKPRTVLKSTTVDDFDTIRPPIQKSSKPTFPNPTFRSISAVDAGAARRARARFVPQTSHPVDPLIKSGFNRGLVTPLQRSIRKDTGEKRTFLSTQKKPLAGLVDDMERLAVGDDDRMDLGYEQPSQVVTDILSIVALLASSNWLTKRDGLVNLQHYFRQGKPLLPSELELLRSSFARLITDPSTKLVGIVVDTLYDFVRIHNLQIGSWLYQLLTKLWYRQGSDVAPVVQIKVERLLLLIRESFPAEVQFQHVMRFLTDMSSQSSAFRIKLVVLDYLAALIQSVPMQSDDLKNSSVTRLGITKVITWTVDPKASIEVRQSCQTILVLLNHLNSKEFVDIIDTLEQDIHKTAIKMISTYPRRPSASTEEVILKRKVDVTPLKVASSKEPATPVSEGRYAQSGNRNAGMSGPFLARKGMANDENRNPVASGLDGRNGTGERFAGQEELNGGSDPGGVSPVPEDIQNNLEEQVRYLTTWSEKFVTSSKSKQRQLLEHLHYILPMIKEDVWQGHFMTVLPLLYDLLHSSGHDNDITSGTLICFADLLRLRPNQMRQLPELTIVNLLEIQRNASKAVTKACDECLKLAVHVFPCDVVVKILSPIIINQPPPENAAAVRFFSLICQNTRDKGALVPTLPLIAPLLVSAYAKSEESTMRKECVYGLIYLQLSVGEDLMEPYYRELSASKIRLMNVYLKRIVQG